MLDTLSEGVCPLLQIPVANAWSRGHSLTTDMSSLISTSHALDQRIIVLQRAISQVTEDEYVREWQE